MAALSDRDYAADKWRAIDTKRGAEIYPRLLVLGRTWVRQDYAGAPLIVVSGEDVERLVLP
jgi:hypothetical protein